MHHVKRAYLALLLLTAVAGLAVAASPVTIPLNVTVTPTPVTIAVGAQTTTLPVPAAPTPPVPTPPANSAWVYHAGVFSWGGDWSFAGTPNYQDTAGGPTAGPADVAFTGQSNGGWQPYLNAGCQSTVSLCFSTTPYTSLILQLKATKAGQIWDVGFMSSGDTADGLTLVITPYCTAVAVGQWSSCKIPLAAFKLTNPVVLKFWVQGNLTNGNTVWFAQEVGFQ